MLIFMQCLMYILQFTTNYLQVDHSSLEETKTLGERVLYKLFKSESKLQLCVPDLYLCLEQCFVIYIDYIPSFKDLPLYAVDHVL